MAPEITWHDLNESLAPEGVVRTEWALALSAASLPTDALPPRVYKALVEGTATGTWPDGSVPGTEDMPAFFRRNGPAFHVARGRRLDIPVLLGQGTTDTLFPLQQGLANWERALTRKARRDSILVAYNGGHVLPGVLPRGISVTSDPCFGAARGRRLRGARAGASSTSSSRDGAPACAATVGSTSPPRPRRAPPPRPPPRRRRCPSGP